MYRRFASLPVRALIVALALAPAALPLAGAQAADGIFSGLMPLSAGDLAALGAGGPVVLATAESTGGGTAGNTVEIGPEGGVTIHSQSQASATLAGSPVSLSGGGQLSTGSVGAIAMENSAGINTLQLASGLNNIQQNSVSFAFVLSGLPLPQ